LADRVAYTITIFICCNS